MKTKKIPTLIGIVILIASIAAGVIFVRYRQLFRLGAQSVVSPKNVVVANVDDKSFTISWTTEKEVVGKVFFGENDKNLNGTGEDEIKTGLIHSVILRNLKPQTTYYFKIGSSESIFDQNGIPWKVKTGPELPINTRSNFISGSLIDPTGSPAKNALVYMSVAGSLFSTITSQNGGWIIQLSTARSLDLSEYLKIDEETSLLEISANAGPGGVSQAKVYPQSARPVPPMILGQIHDFRNLEPNNTAGVPEALIDLPEELSNAESKFVIPETPSGQDKNVPVTLESIDEGERVTSTKPELFGEGPPGITISIKIESETQEAQIKIPGSGDWKWTPPAGLTEGIHKVTVTWKDAKGITRTLTKTFIVQAAEGPAFEATPSASPTGTTTPTSSPTSTPKTTANPTASSSATPTVILTTVPQPESGSLTPTILFSILGIGAFAASFLVWKYSDA